jgi:hypothetical protein
LPPTPGRQFFRVSELPHKLHDEAHADGIRVAILALSEALKECQHHLADVEARVRASKQDTTNRRDDGR